MEEILPNIPSESSFSSNPFPLVLSACDNVKEFQDDGWPWRTELVGQKKMFYLSFPAAFSSPPPLSPRVAAGIATDSPWRIPLIPELRVGFDGHRQGLLQKHQDEAESRSFHSCLPLPSTYCTVVEEIPTWLCFL